MLQIRLLGQFDIRLDGKRVTISSRAGQSLLAYISLTAGTPHRREKLSGLFWPDTSDESARKNLRQELWRIRKALAGQNPTTDYLLADEYAITFNRNADYWLDATQLERPDLDIESLTSNLSLYQDELLPGFFDDWIVLERERIQTIFETKMEQLLSQLVTAERWLAVQEQGERWLALGNTPEPAYRALMLAHGARGDIAKVSSVYQRCIADLDEKIGLEPSAETRALYDGLLKGTHTPRPAAFQQSGTITFLFTDIEESTNLLDKLGNDYATVLADHHKIMRAAILNWNGNEVDTQGDAFFVTFKRAMDAIQCAAEAQQALAAHPWLHRKPLRVRMGLHTGEPLIASTGYVGMDVHRAARIGDSAHGGQVLLSHTTRELVVNDLPKSLAIRDLGEHRLKDLKFPTPIYQLVIQGLSVDFPPIRTKFSGTEAPTAGEPPFKGLQYFDEVDAELFFGREVLTAKLVKRLRESQFLSVVIGASGSGKSSVVRAGVIPSLRKGVALIDGTVPPEDSVNWRVHILTPTAHPLEALATELTRDSESVTAIATLMDDLMQDPRSLGLFLGRQNSKRHILLVLDQFEELFTLCRDDFEREAFIDNLLTALTPTPLPEGEGRRGEGKITLILTLRADFYAHLAQYPELRDAVAHQQEYIGPMTTEELRRAIEEPAKRAHWTFEPGLVDLILRDVGDEPGALPLLSHALLETWKRRAGHTLTLKGYADAGGVRGAISHTAENVYQNLSLAEQALARNIFLRLTELGEGTEDTRRRASFDELMSHTENAEDVSRVLNRLAEARLVTLSENTAEVAHEALIREWSTLREWLNQDREGLRLHRNITEGTQEWELLEHDPDTLYRGARLSQAREWAALHPNALNANENAFLSASNELEQHEQAEREAQQQRELEAVQKLAESERLSLINLRGRNRVITTVGSIAVILALLAGTFGLRAENEKQLATSRELAAAAINNLQVDSERSVLLALEALSTANTKEAEDALHRAVEASRLRLTLTGHTREVIAVAYSSDGTRIVTGSADGTAQVWDATTGKLLLTLSDHTDAIFSVAYSPDGKSIATASIDKTAKVWEAATGKLLLTFSGHTDGVEGVAYSPDGKHILTGSTDKTAQVWEAATGKLLLTFSGHTDGIIGVAYSPDGTRIATASADMTAKVWDASTGAELFTLSGYQDAVGAAAFSPDGKRLAIASDDGTLKIWDALSGKELLNLTGNNSGAYGVAFNPDGTRLATGSQEGTARVWDALSGEELLTLAGNAGAVYNIAFSPDCVGPPNTAFEVCGTRLVSGNRNGTAMVWDVTPAGSQELFMAPGFDGRISPDGTQLAILDFSGPNAINIQVWRLAEVSNSAQSEGEPQELFSVMASHAAEITSPSLRTLGGNLSPDNTRFATVSSDMILKVWDITNGKELLNLSVSTHTLPVTRVGFSSDNTHIATASYDMTAKVWDAANGRELLTLSGHTDILTDVAFSPDGTRLATCSSDGTAKVWDAIMGRELFTLVGHTGPVIKVVFSPDGKLIATASFDATVKLWDAATGKLLLTLSGHTATVRNVAFSPDGTRLASASNDGTVKVWSFAPSPTDSTLINRELLTLMPGTSASASFSPDGTRLITGSFPGLVRVYLLNIEELIALAKSRVTRSLTTEECQKYLHVEACPTAP